MFLLLSGGQILTVFFIAVSAVLCAAVIFKSFRQEEHIALKPFPSAKLNCCVAELRTLQDLVEDIERAGVHPRILFDFNLALEEFFIMLSNHAFIADADRNIILERKVDKKTVQAEMIYVGNGYNPLLQGEFNKDALLRDDIPDGLELLLALQMADDVKYERRGKKDVLIVMKNRIQDGKEGKA